MISDNSNNNTKKMVDEPLITLVTITTDNIEKTLFKFELKKSGDVLMYCKHAQFYRESGTKPTDEIEIKQQRYSFHKSEKSESNINFIKQTFDLNTPDIINTYISTPEIKKKSGFIHIFSRRCPDLSPDRHNAKIKSKYRILNIDEFDYKISTLFYSLFIGSSKIDVPHKVATANTSTFVIGDFRFLVVWEYLPFPSHNTGSLIHSRTHKTDDGTIIGQIDGVNTSGAIEQSGLFHQSLIDEYNTTLNSFKEIPTNHIMNIFETTGFIKSGKRDSPKMIKAIRKLISKNY
ncbi:hypothetical protein A3N63_24745 [Klebsiella aerogenes]|uniref:hypothetical protein n=1 Tax=Klebsiella aerogenes TaxID=548 RepID=UPI0007B3EAA8|nr:hypothetical protein [Klebsiella aerogenes]KZQ99170.1 hypothetical protein A3N63_24745 [Klebsiella aerogenes]